MPNALQPRFTRIPSQEDSDIFRRNVDGYSSSADRMPPIGCNSFTTLKIKAYVVFITKISICRCTIESVNNCLLSRLKSTSVFVFECCLQRRSDLLLLVWIRGKNDWSTTVYFIFNCAPSPASLSHTERERQIIYTQTRRRRRRVIIITTNE